MTTVQRRTGGEAQTKQIIVPTGQRLGYIDAFNAVRDKGGLPSNVFHDDELVRSDDWKQLRSYYPAWAREVLVYPEKNGVFKKGRDAEDAITDNANRKWILPASCIPKEAIGVKGVALFVDPESVEVYGERVAIISKPESIIILTPFMQTDGWGRMDARTRVPLALPRDADELNNRYLWRIDGTGVRPLVRGWGAFGFSDRRNVIASYGQDLAFGVGSVGREATAPKIEAVKATTEGILVVSGYTNAEQINTLLRQSREEISNVTGVVRAERLESTRKLLEALRIKE